MGYKSCGNCGRGKECRYYTICIPQVNFPLWEQIECPLCGGTLSEIRYHNDKKYRHCYACHFEFPIGEIYR